MFGKVETFFHENFWSIEIIKQTHSAKKVEKEQNIFDDSSRTADKNHLGAFSYKTRGGNKNELSTQQLLVLCKTSLFKR